MSAMASSALLLTVLLASTAGSASAGASRRLAADLIAGVSDAVVRATDLSQGGAQECPAGCAPDFCAYVATSGGFYCQKCLNNLLVRKTDGLCGCPAGKYSPDGTATCRDCPMGSWCSGGVYTDTDYPQAVRCPGNMTTRGMRSSNINACLNLPGFAYYNLNGLLLALQCPVNTFGPGLRKQRACVPCPSGFSTMGKVGQSRIDACVVPPGYFLKTPGQAVPCPAGEYKEGVGPDASCTKCAFGVTTPASGSTSNTSCSYLLAGWYARNMSGSIITATAPCPQGYVCPGGPANSTFDPANPTALLDSEPSIKRCPQGTWTAELASTVVSQCLTPPGFKTVNGSTVPCEPGAYRDGWVPAEQAARCTSCGSGVSADKTDRVIQYDLVTGALSYLPVTTSASDCYILPGQGLYYETLAQSWRARNCDGNEYGVDKITYGLNAFPCRGCPLNMVASTNRTGYPRSAAFFVRDNATGAQGFTSPLACVNQAGYGYNGRVSQPCSRGTWNTQDNYDACTPCDYGLTTQAVGSGKSRADCGLAAGFGNSAGAVAPCPIGSYNNASYTRGTTTACSSCPNGTTTAAEGGDSVSLCNLCMGGWGEASCQTQCGGKGGNASYGINGRPMDSACTTCSFGNTGFSFQWKMQNDLFVAQAVAPIGADSAWDCVSEFAQLADSAWYLPTADNTAMNVTANVSTFAACVALCTAPDCEYVTYDYARSICYVRIGYEPIYMGAPLIAFKAVPSGDVATNAFSVAAASSGGTAPVRHRHGVPFSTSSTGSSGDVAASSSAGSSIQPSVTAQTSAEGASVASGQYSFWIEPNAASVGYQVEAPGRDNFTLGYAGLQQCLDECDLVSWCAGITMDLFVDIPTSPRSCKLIRGDTNPGRFLRTVTRADVDRLRVPALFT